MQRRLAVALLLACVQLAGSLVPRGDLGSPAPRWSGRPSQRCARQTPGPGVRWYAGPLDDESHVFEPGALRRLARRLESLQAPRDGVRRLLGRNAANATLAGGETGKWGTGNYGKGARWMTNTSAVAWAGLGARVERRLASIRESRRIASMQLLLRNATQWEFATRETSKQRGTNPIGDAAVGNARRPRAQLRSARP